MDKTIYSAQLLINSIYFQLCRLLTYIFSCETVLILYFELNIAELDWSLDVKQLSVNL